MYTSPVEVVTPGIFWGTGIGIGGGWGWGGFGWGWGAWNMGWGGGGGKHHLQQQHLHQQDCEILITITIPGDPELRDKAHMVPSQPQVDSVKVAITLQAAESSPVSPSGPRRLNPPASGGGYHPTGGGGMSPISPSGSGRLSSP